MSEVVPIQRQRPAASMPVIVPQDLDQAFRMATAIQQSGLAPKSFQTPQAIMVAIMSGMEVGFKPLQALQSIAVVNGKPTIYGDGAAALVWASGLCEELDETIEGEGDARKATCRTKRKGKKSETVRTFSVADAKQAKLWGKQGPWQQYPDRMLQMRARAFCLRDVYADVLSGLGVYEEVRDYVDVAPASERKSIAQRKRDGEFEAWLSDLHTTKTKEAAQDYFSATEGDRTGWPASWVEAAADKLDAHVKSLQPKGRVRQKDDTPYAEQSNDDLNRQGIISEFEEYASNCTLPSEIMTEAARVQALPEMHHQSDRDRITEIMHSRIDEIGQ